MLILNGPNLRRLGVREPDIYGAESYDDLVNSCRETAEELDLQVDIRQTDDEAELVRWLHEAADGGLPVILNPAAFTHYSYALRDAVAMLAGPVIEVHLTNPAAREDFRRYSVLTGVSTGTIAGFGFDSYRLAMQLLSIRLG